MKSLSNGAILKTNAVTAVEALHPSEAMENMRITRTLICTTARFTIPSGWAES